MLALTQKMIIESTRLIPVHIGDEIHREEQFQCMSSLNSSHTLSVKTQDSFKAGFLITHSRWYTIGYGRTPLWLVAD